MGNNSSSDSQYRGYYSSNPYDDPPPHQQTNTSNPYHPSNLSNQPPVASSQNSDTFMTPPPTITVPSSTTTHPNQVSSVVQSGDNNTSLHLAIIAAKTISEGNIFKTTDEVSYALQNYHHHVKKQCRVYKVKPYIIHHICVEKYRFIRKDTNWKPLNEADHLCKASHIARRQSDGRGGYSFIVTESIPHTCNTSSVLSTPKSRKSPFTTKLMSSVVRDFIRKDPFHQSSHIGQFVEAHFHLPDKTLNYQTCHRVRSHAINEHFGSVHWQYSTIVSRLEQIKKNDPDSLILMKVFPDTLPESCFDNRLDESSLMSDLTSVDHKSRSSFCLRFGAIAITPGTSVRRHRLNASNDYTSCRLNSSMDACHLTGNERGCMTDILQLLAGDEYLLDTFTVDAQNECRDVWHFSLACDKQALKRSTLHSFCGDRLKGQDAVNEYVYPEMDFTKCHFHIKDNIKNNSGVILDQDIFTEIAYSISDTVRDNKIKKYMRSHRPEAIKTYFSKSLLPDK